jgi:hypothetical protein
MFYGINIIVTQVKGLMINDEENWWIRKMYEAERAVPREINLKE